MGGAAGHMMHPYDAFTNVKEFFNNFKNGKYLATEKVDGLNIFVGYNNSGKIIFLRNKNQEPIENISEKFHKTHIAYTAFTTGCKVLKNKFEQLSYNDRIKFNLINENGTTKNFINLEILYGPTPNVVSYSIDTNFIVFHSLVGIKENGWKQNGDIDFYKLSHKLDDAFIDAKEIVLIGTPYHMNLHEVIIKTYWKFIGPIRFSKNEIKEKLKDLEIDDIKDSKELTKRVGIKILKSMKSKLSDFETGGPRIEGLVVDVDSSKVKITGSFYDTSKPEDLKVVDGIKSIREYVQKDILGLNVTTLNSLKENTIESLHNFILERRKKSYDYNFDNYLEKHHISKLSEIIIESQNIIKRNLPSVKRLGRHFDLKNLNIQSYLIYEFQKRLLMIQKIKDLINLYAEIFYNVK
jgi:hypothetical protein